MKEKAPKRRFYMAVSQEKTNKKKMDLLRQAKSLL